MKLTRRTFIMATGAGAGWLVTGCATEPGATAAATSAAPRTSAFVPRAAKPSAPSKGDWVGSTCQGCTQWCAIQIFVQDGRAVKVRGNPLSKTNHGYVCPRGHMIPQQMYDPDRVKTPMKRTNPVKGRGIDPKFVPISWDEALDTVAEKMMELRRAGEPGKLMYMRGRYSPTSTDLAYGTLPKIWGTANYFSHSAICAEAEKMGPGLTQGFYGYRDYDLEKTNCLVVWGCDPLASNRMVPNTIHRFHEIVKRGTVIAVDPRLSNAAAKAQEWLPLAPGSDGALAGAIAHVLLTEGLWNREFVGDFKDGKSLNGETYSVISYNPADKSTQPYWEDKTAAISGCTSSGAEMAAKAGAKLPAMNQYTSGDATPLRVGDTIEKCTFCHHRTLNGLQPACVEVCPSQARIFGDQEDPKSQISMILAKEKSFRLQEEKGTKPNVHYIGKYSARA